MAGARRCSRTACREAAVATLTYVYADSTAVVGALSAHPRAHGYDLCRSHAERLTGPRGWNVVRQPVPGDALLPLGEEIEALADAVREPVLPPAGGDEPSRGHLRMLRSPS